MPTEQKNIAPGEIIEGKVQGITTFGAFIELGEGSVGLVHISEIADTYVKDVKDFIQEGETVKVKVLNVAGKKIGLSIKQVKSPVASPPRSPRPARPAHRSGGGSYDSNRNSNRQATPVSLDDKITKFLKESEERMQPLKNRMEPKKRNRYS
ncbi:MAG TPA: S1 RNA-binding domain-containing protein [Syntrophomonadaceae bacterium]|nr:S1 RNA-binding domain-containing protein [Syntrophomonadaceae bacterium]